MPITRLNIPKSLVLGVHEFVGLSYAEAPEEHLPLYEVLTTDKAFEEDVMMSGLGSAQVKGEGQSTPYDDITEEWTARYTPQTVALGVSMTHEAFADDQYGNLLKTKSKAVGKAMADAKQVKAAAIFNRGFNSSYVGGDGQPLFSASHPTIAGTFDNAYAVDLSESALEDMCVDASKLTDSRGVLISARAQSLHIPPELSFVAEKLLKSDLSTGVGVYGNATKAVNDINALKSTGKFPGGVFVNHRFTDPDAWFVKTSVGMGTRMFIREGLVGKEDVDFDSDNIMFKFRERYCFGWTDPRQWLGSAGA